MGKIKQTDLFGEEILETTKLEITPKRQEPLSKTQKDFNTITKRVAKLEIDLEHKEKSLEIVLHYFHKHLEPMFKKEANQKIDMAFLFDKKLEENKFSKRTQEELKELIFTLLEIAFRVVEPTSEMEVLYDKYSEFSYQETKKEEMDLMKSMFSEMFSNEFGDDLDIQNFNLENEDEMARFQSKLKEKMIAEEKAFKEYQAEKPKSKKQLEKEFLEKAKEDAKKKSIKSIYLSLSKVLHPDTESDEILKIEKEELMKKVNIAYEDKDLATLLKLEMQWVYNTTENLTQLSDEKLKIYIAVLRDRANELEVEKYSLIHHPRFNSIENMAHMHEKSAIKAIESDKSKIHKNYSIFKNNMSIIEKIKNKNELKEFISDCYEAIVVPEIYKEMFDY